MKNTLFLMLFYEVLSGPPSPRAAFHQNCSKGGQEKGPII